MATRRRLVHERLHPDGPWRHRVLSKLGRRGRGPLSKRSNDAGLAAGRLGGGQAKSGKSGLQRRGIDHPEVSCSDLSALDQVNSPRPPRQSGDDGRWPVRASAEYQDVHSVATMDLCEYHDYQPQEAIPGDKWNGLQVRIDQSNTLNKPLFVGERDHPSDRRHPPSPRNRTRRGIRAQFSAGIVGNLHGPETASGPRLTTTTSAPGTRTKDTESLEQQKTGSPAKDTWANGDAHPLRLAPSTRR